MGDERNEKNNRFNFYNPGLYNSVWMFRLFQA